MAYWLVSVVDTELGASAPNLSAFNNSNCIKCTVHKGCIAIAKVQYSKAEKADRWLLVYDTEANKLRIETELWGIRHQAKFLNAKTCNTMGRYSSMQFWYGFSDIDTDVIYANITKLRANVPMLSLMGIVIENSHTNINKYTCNTYYPDIVIPDGCTSIGNLTGSRCINIPNKPIRNLVIPNSCTQILNNVFTGLKIENVVINSTVLLHSGAFNKCEITNLIFSDNIAYIHSRAFAHSVIKNKVDLSKSIIWGTDCDDDVQFEYCLCSDIIQPKRNIKKEIFRLYKGD